MSFALSPDGRQLVFAGSDGFGKDILFLRPLDAPEASALPGTEGASYPFWSPDSRFVGFFAAGKLKKIDIAGGPPQTLCDASGNRGGTWNRNDVILLAPDFNGPIYRVSVTGGMAKTQTALDPSRQEYSHRWPQFLPDGKHFLYVALSANPEHAGIYVGSLESNESRRLTGAYSSIGYISGYLLYVRGKTLLAHPFDSSRLELIGEPIPVVSGVGSAVGIGIAHFSVSESGVLAYHAHTADDALPVWLDRSGKRLGVLGPRGEYSPGNLSPDDERLAFNRSDPQFGVPDIWIADLSQGTTSRFTSHAAHDFSPVWSPDGMRLVFTSNRLAGGGNDLFLKASNATGEEELLLKTGATNVATDWSTDGRFILYQASLPGTNYDSLGAPSRRGAKADRPGTNGVLRRRRPSLSRRPMARLHVR